LSWPASEFEISRNSLLQKEQVTASFIPEFRQRR